MGPLIPMGIIPDQWNSVMAVLIGVAFGFVLESSGFSSSRKIVGLFYGYDFTVLRVFFTAAVTTAVGLAYFSYVGWIDMSLAYIHPTYLTAAIVGGLIMGLGFITGGFCPGTSLCAVAIGKIDGIIFTIGLMLGIFIFSEGYPVWEGLYNGNYLGSVKVTESLGISDNLFIFLFAVMALAAFYVTSLIGRRIKEVNY
ncbi:MAG: YeeE/YedE family protein [Bacteroidales bacterium]|nr:YeeE/YedE family protein [Bacteroidales bacterium]